MTKFQIIVTVLAVLGSILTFIGYLIKYRNKIQLIAGVYENEQKITNKMAFASIVGGNLIVLGTIFCSGAVGIYIYPQCKVIIEPILLISVLVIGIIIFIKTKKYVISH